MNCYLHADHEAKAFCRTCGKPLCSACQRTSGGTVYCPEHEPAAQTAAPAAPSGVPPPSVSPGLAFALGLIPGVGAIYNGQYVKGLIHVVVLGTLISVLDSGAIGSMEPLFGLLIALWFFYMAFEAYHTAGKRLRGEPVDEFSSLIPMRSPQAGSTAAAVVLIALGSLFLVMNARPDWARLIFRYWPVLLIVAGVWILAARWRGRGSSRHHAEEAGHVGQ
ncbi:MAG: B-box zinc finger protein [Bryobacterales bacterium]|nr:B-box zinc finger protein [Bryobacterales bacterium]